MKRLRQRAKQTSRVSQKKIARTPNPKLNIQTRRLLAKHYANKHGIG